MRRALLAIVLWLSLWAPVFGAPLQASEPTRALESAQQVVLVRADGWDDLHATLQCYERVDAGWRAVGAAVPAVLGRRGLGWGRGVVPVEGEAGPVKREGDQRAPAGVFRLTGAFGFASPAHAGTRMPYLQLRAGIEAVDDPRSKYYNQVVDVAKVTRDWGSAERMRKVREYRWGLFVGHNVAPAHPGAGSCIFLHLWDGPDVGTAGCTGVEEAPLVAVLKWLRPDAQPLLVQLPRSVYARQRAAWGLP